LEYKKTHITTDDAFVDGRIHVIASKIPGTVKLLYVKDNQFVKMNDLILELDLFSNCDAILCYHRRSKLFGQHYISPARTQRNFYRIGQGIYAAQDNASCVFTENQLHLDLDGFKQNLVEAQSNALVLSLNAAYPIPENIVMLIQTVHRKALGLALNAAIPTSETINDLLRKAHAEASSLNAKLPDAQKG
jgi:hypothetical protein